MFLNLYVNWSRTLMDSMKGEIKKVVRQFDDKGLFCNLVTKKRLNFCSKISLIFLANFQRTDWDDAMEFSLNNKISPTCASSRCPCASMTTLTSLPMPWSGPSWWKWGSLSQSGCCC